MISNHQEEYRAKNFRKPNTTSWVDVRACSNITECMRVKRTKNRDREKKWCSKVLLPIWWIAFWAISLKIWTINNWTSAFGAVSKMLKLFSSIHFVIYNISLNHRSDIGFSFSVLCLHIISPENRCECNL